MLELVINPDGAIRTLIAAEDTKKSNVTQMTDLVGKVFTYILMPGALLVATSATRRGAAYNGTWDISAVNLISGNHYTLQISTTHNVTYFDIKNPKHLELAMKAMPYYVAYYKRYFKSTHPAAWEALDTIQDVIAHKEPDDGEET